MAIARGKKCKIMMMGSNGFELIIGEFIDATDRIPTHCNIVGKQVGWFSPRIIKENEDILSIEERTYKRNGETYYLLRHDLSGDADHAQLPATTHALYKGIESNNAKLMQQVAALQRQLKTLEGESKFKRKQIEEAKHIADTKKAEWSYRGSEYWGGEGGMPLPYMRR